MAQQSFRLLTIFEMVQYRFNRTFGEANVDFSLNRAVFNYPCKSSVTCAPYEIHLQPGIYRIELWGAQGGNGRFEGTGVINVNSGGKGAYVRGDITVENNLTLFLYLGAKGQDQISRQHIRNLGGWNGGGNGGMDIGDRDDPESGAGGGGSVDIILQYFDMNKVDNSLEFQRSIKSRIMVAGSGGGGCSADYVSGIYANPIGGAGGGLEAPNVSDRSVGGTQIRGQYGIGSQGKDENWHGKIYGGSTAGGGSGYRGSLDFHVMYQQYYIETSSAGGSSYISGHPGCMSPSATDNDLNSTNNAFHHSGFYFQNTFMIPGNEQMPSPDFKLIRGHSGNGVAAISLLTEEHINPFVGVQETCDDRVYGSFNIGRASFIALVYEMSI